MKGSSATGRPVDVLEAPDGSLLVSDDDADENHVNITFICYDGSALAAAEQSNPYNASINVTYIPGYSDGRVLKILVV